MLRRALDLGVNHIDTAAFYFSPLRSANELINRALAPYPEDLVITTKVWPGRDPSSAPGLNFTGPPRYTQGPRLSTLGLSMATQGWRPVLRRGAEDGQGAEPYPG